MKIVLGLTLSLVTALLVWGSAGGGTAFADGPRGQADQQFELKQTPKPGSFILVAAEGGRVAGSCETGPGFFSCVGKGWLFSKACEFFGGEIVYTGPTGVMLCQRNDAVG